MGAGQPGRCCGGTLTLDERGRAKLETSDTVTDGWFPEGVALEGDAVFLPAVHGEVFGRAVTLFNCTVYTLFLNFGAVELVPVAVLDGLWLDDTSDCVLSEVVVELEHLATWTKRSTLQFASIAQQQEHTSTPVAVFTSVPPVAAVVDDRTVSVESWYRRSGKFTNMGMVITFSEHASFGIKYRDATDITRINADIRVLQDLVSFATGSVSAVTSVRVAAADSTEVAAPDTPNMGRLLKPNLVSPNPDGQPVPASLMAFTMEDFDFADFMPRWFAHHSKFQPVFLTLLAHRSVSSQFLENQVLDTIAAAEQTYRAADMPEYFITEGHAKKVRTAIRDAIATIPELAMLAKRIAGQVDRRVTLDERLRELANRLGPVATKVFGDGDGFDRWLEAAKRSRNDIAHTGSTSRFDVEALQAVVNGAKALVELTLFAELGLDHERLSHVVHQHHRSTASRIASSLPPPTASGS